MMWVVCKKCGTPLEAISTGYVCRKCHPFFYMNYQETVQRYNSEFVPIIHAHIVTDWLGDSSCSNCGKKYIDATSKYCSECGAKFDEPPVDKDRFSKEGD